MDWFRMYGDMPNDPKIGTLSDAEFRTWVELLCAACKAEREGGTGLTKDTVNWSLRRNVTETLQKLIEADLVCYSETGELIICKWEKRQYASDSSTDRVRKYREKQKNQEVSSGNTDETLQKRSSNGLDTDTEQIQNREEKKKTTPDGELFPNVDGQVVIDFKAMRNKQKAAITKTAIEGIEREAAKAGMSLEAALRMCCERGWRGFKAEWVQQQARGSPTYQTANDKAKSLADRLTGRTRDERTNTIIDITPATAGKLG